MAQVPSNYRWWVLAASTITQLCAALASQGIGVWASFAQRRFSFTNTQLGFLAGVANAVPIIGLVVVGAILDRRGERGLVFAGMMVLTLALFTLGTATGMAGLFAAMILIGIGYSPIQPGGSKAIYHWFAPNQRGLAMGIRQAALPLGGALAAGVLPPLLVHRGWFTAMSVAATLIAMGGIFFVLIYRNPPLRTASSGLLVRPWHGLARHWSHERFRSIASLGIVLVAAQTAVSVFWVLYLTDRFGISLERAAVNLLFLQVAGSLGRVALSAISDHRASDRRGVVLACAGSVAAGFAIVACMPSTWPAWSQELLSVAIGFFGFGWYGPWVVWLTESADQDQVGEVLGFAMSLNQVAIALTPIGFGYLVDRTTTFTVPWAGFSLLLAATLLYQQSHTASRSRRPAH